MNEDVLPLFAKDETLETLIRRHNIKLTDTGGITFVFDVAKKEAVTAEIAAVKDDLKAYLIKKKEYTAEYKRREQAIEGVREIEQAIREQADWSDAFQREMEKSDPTYKIGSQPPDRIAEMKQRYPRAAAYLYAKNCSYASHDVKATLGHKAMNAIVRGEGYADAIDEMEQKWSAYTNREFDGLSR